MAAKGSIASVLIVHDDQQVADLIQQRLLTAGGYSTALAETVAEAQEKLDAYVVDVVILDVRLPDGSGIEVLERMRSAGSINFDTPVIAVTAFDPQREAELLSKGATDFVSSPFELDSLVARIRRSYEMIASKRATATELERVSRERWLQRFLPQAWVEHYRDHPELLKQHDAEIACVFLELRGFSEFARNSRPELVMSVLSAYHGAIEPLVEQFGATVGSIAGDGVLLYLNDPISCEEPVRRAVEIAIEVQRAMRTFVAAWREQRFALGVGAGVSWGSVTMAEIGFSSRREYTPLGPSINRAARICGLARDGEVLIDTDALVAAGDAIETEEVTTTRPAMRVPEGSFAVFRVSGLVGRSG